MHGVVIIAILGCLTITTLKASAETNVSLLAEDLEFLKAEVSHLKEENLELKNVVKSMRNRKEAVAIEVFDCVRDNTRDEDGILPYDECLVDTTMDSPQLQDGRFKVAEEGLYRLTFMGEFFIDPVQDTTGEQPFATANLLIDDDGDGVGFQLITRASLNPVASDTAGYYPVSINTIQHLYPEQVLTIYLEFLEGYARLTGMTHFTGQFLGTDNGQDR